MKLCTLYYVVILASVWAAPRHAILQDSDGLSIYPARGILKKDTEQTTQDTSFEPEAGAPDPQQVKKVHFEHDRPIPLAPIYESVPNQPHDSTPGHSQISEHTNAQSAPHPQRFDSNHQQNYGPGPSLGHRLTQPRRSAPIPPPGAVLDNRQNPNHPNRSLGSPRRSVPDSPRGSLPRPPRKSPHRTAPTPPKLSGLELLGALQKRVLDHFLKYPPGSSREPSLGFPYRPPQSQTQRSAPGALPPVERNTHLDHQLPSPHLGSGSPMMGDIARHELPAHQFFWEVLQNDPKLRTMNFIRYLRILYHKLHEEQGSHNQKLLDHIAQIAFKARIWPSVFHATARASQDSINTKEFQEKMDELEQLLANDEFNGYHVDEYIFFRDIKAVTAEKNAAAALWGLHNAEEAAHKAVKEAYHARHAFFDARKKLLRQSEA